MQLYTERAVILRLTVGGRSIAPKWGLITTGIRQLLVNAPINLPNRYRVAHVWRR